MPSAAQLACYAERAKIEVALRLVLTHSWSPEAWQELRTSAVLATAGRGAARSGETGLTVQSPMPSRPSTPAELVPLKPRRPVPSPEEIVKKVTDKRPSPVGQPEKVELAIRIVLPRGGRGAADGSCYPRDSQA